MKFFTPDWYATDACDQSAFEAYRDYVAQIADVLPREIHDFMRACSLHDGLLRRASVERDAVELVVLTGDLQVGYRDTHLVYLGAAI